LSSLLPHNFKLKPPTYMPSDHDLDAVAELIDRHEKVTIYCGAGVRNAHAEVLELADRIKAPIGYTLRGKEWIERDNPYAVGLTGLIGFGGCTKALKDADLLLLVGTDFPYREYIPEGKMIVQIDSRPEHLGRRARLDYGIAGDAALTLCGLLERVAQKSEDLHLRAARKLHEQARRKLDVYVRHTGGQSPVHPEFVAAILDRLACEDTIFIADTGMSAVWAARYLNMSPGRRLIGSFNHGSMANAMPQAIGAQLAYPGRQVVAMCGDGGLTMLLGDLSTIATYELPVTVIVFDNGLLDMVHWEMLAEGFEPYETELTNPDFAKLADAYGFLGIGVDRHDEVPAVHRRARPGDRRLTPCTRWSRRAWRRAQPSDQPTAYPGARAPMSVQPGGLAAPRDVWSPTGCTERCTRRTGHCHGTTWSAPALLYLCRWASASQSTSCRPGCSER
jgi:pyruvate dehydrogenase (quinone)